MLSLPQCVGEGWVVMLPFAYLTPIASMSGDRLCWSVLFLTLPLREKGEEGNHNKQCAWLQDLLIVLETPGGRPGVPTLDIQFWPVTSECSGTVSHSPLLSNKILSLIDVTSGNGFLYFWHNRGYSNIATFRKWKQSVFM